MDRVILEGVNPALRESSCLSPRGRRPKVVGPWARATAFRFALKRSLPRPRSRPLLLLAILGWLLLLSPRPASAAADLSQPTLTNFNQILSLSLAEARETSYPVRVRGIVAFASRGGRELTCLHDGTNGLGVGILTVAGLGVPLSSQPKPGDYIEVVGETAAGSSHPYVARSTIRVLGPGQFVEARAVRGRDVAAGSYHGKMVRYRAVVLDVSRVRGSAEYLLTADGNNFVATVAEPADRLPLDLLNATVEVQGMPWIQLDSNRKPSGYRLLIASNSWVRVVHAGSSNLFAGRRVNLAGASNAPIADDRMVISGVVTYSWPNHLLTFEDATGAGLAYFLDPIASSVRDGEYVERPPRTPLRPGDRIDLVGSKNARRAFSPHFVNCEYQVTGHTGLGPAPIISEKEALTGLYDCRRVRMQGRIVDRDAYDQFGLKVNRLFVKFGDLTTTALYVGNRRIDFAATTGSQVELTALCMASAGAERPVRTFGLYLSSPDDVRVLPEPPVWLSPVALRIGSVAGGMTALALGWVWLLRRQVAGRTFELKRSNAQLEAEVRERTRAEAELAARVKLLALNAEIAEALNAPGDLASMLQRGAAGLVRHLDAVFARVWTLNAETRTLELEASAGLYTHLDGPHSRVPLGQLKIGLIAQEKAPHLTNDVQNDPRVSDKAWARREGLTAFAGYPLMLEGAVLGVVAIFSRVALGKDTLLALGSAAHSLALGIERKRTEAELLRALERERELNELKTSFVSMVSHEFRTPLEVIITSADILARYLDRLAPADRAEHLKAIQGSVKRMSGMMEDVLLLGRFESERQPFRPDDVHLNAYCRRLTDEIRSATGGRCPIELDLDDTLPLARADEHLLRHILTNLLSNAVKYSPAGAPVRLQVRRDRHDVVIRVEDSGLGIPVADQARLFEAFHRGRNTGRIPGTGLGLVIVKRSLALHGGQIEFTSQEGQGTQFTVRLPAFNDAEP
jgi:signal transduction histidine kinase